MNPWLSGLNPEQQEAVLHNSGPMLVLAGAGSGKTTVLVSRAGRLVDEKIVSSKGLSVLTFTNKAARELKNRVSSRLGGAAEGIWAGTFHSFGLYWLRRFHSKVRLNRDFGIIDPVDATALIRELLADFVHAEKDAFDTDKLLFLLSRWRENGQTKAQAEDPYEEALEWLLPKFDKKLELLGVVDFDQLILKPLQLIKESDAVRAEVHRRCEQLMVDEFQDTSRMQMEFVDALSGPAQNLCVVGDDDQSIYGWRGACLSNILNFPKLHPNCKLVRLERNYRSTPMILDIANKIIEANKQRHRKVLKAEVAAQSSVLPEMFVYGTEEEEAEGVCNEIQRLIRQGAKTDEIAVLYRSNSQAALLEGELRSHQLPYKLSGGTAFFDRREIRDVLAYLMCADRPKDLPLRRILNVPPRGLGEKTTEKLLEFAEVQGGSFHSALERWEAAGVEASAGKIIQEFLEKLQTLGTMLRSTAQPGAGVLTFLQAIGYKQFLHRLWPDALSFGKRWKRIELFVQLMDRIYAREAQVDNRLSEFLDYMMLRDADDHRKEEIAQIQLMTLHAAKGLEFPYVFLIGIEEDILPHKTLGSDLPEERRLFYVGVTRAKKHLIFTRASTRRRHGQMVRCVPSRFLLEIPKELFTQTDGPRPVNETDRKAMLEALYKKWDSPPPKTLPVK